MSLLRSQQDVPTLVRDAVLSVLRRLDVLDEVLASETLTEEDAARVRTFVATVREAAEPLTKDP
jgi:hypothetical protein